MKNKFLRVLAGFLCIVVFACVVLGAGYMMSAFLRPYDGESIGETTEETTGETTGETTNETTEETTVETTQETTGETTSPGTQLPALQLSAKKAFLYIPRTGELVMIKGKADDRIYPASLTKLFTAYVALQYMSADQKVTVGDELSMVADGSSLAGLSRGDVVTVQTLIEGMLLPSGNDAATVLAVAAGRVIAKNPALSYRTAMDRFVKEMNAQAKLQGMTGTKFANADGLHRSDHYTTCRDMEKISSLAMENVTIRRAVGSPEKFVELKNTQVKSWENRNLLLQEDSPYYNPNALGLKTGYTKSAGYCLVAAFEVSGEEIIVGVFGGAGTNDRFVDAQKIYEAYKK